MSIFRGLGCRALCFSQLGRRFSCDFSRLDVLILFGLIRLGQFKLSDLSGRVFFLHRLQGSLKLSLPFGELASSGPQLSEVLLRGVALLLEHGDAASGTFGGFRRLVRDPFGFLQFRCPRLGVAGDCGLNGSSGTGSGGGCGRRQGGGCSHSLLQHHRLKVLNLALGLLEHTLKLQHSIVFRRRYGFLFVIFLFR